MIIDMGSSEPGSTDALAEEADTGASPTSTPQSQVVWRVPSPVS